MLKFEYQFDEASPKVSVEISAEPTLAQAIEAFEQFLRGAGYYFEGAVVIESSEEDLNETFA